MIQGFCAARFGAVREAFAANFAERGEIGAAVCVLVGGEVVVDLYGGSADATGSRPWQPDTLVNVYSVGKAMTALCALRLIGEGRLDVDSPASAYWPEFGAAGKEAVTVRQLLSHQAGLPAVRPRLPPNGMLDWELMVKALAAHEPWWPPGSAHGYHVNTFGFLIGEIVRRIDGRSLGRFFQDEVAGPLGADIHIGLPASEEHRVAAFLPHVETPPEEEPQGVVLDDPDRLMEHNAYFNPSGISGFGVVNTRAWRAAEIPSTNGHGSARGVAKVYAALVDGGRPVVDPGVLREARSEQVNGDDLVLRRPSRFGLGFQLTQPGRPLGPGDSGFGHFGAGGSLGFCDPDARLAFGYVMNQMGPSWQNPRNRALIDAVYASLASA